VITAISDAPESKFGRPGGPHASKTFIFVTLTLESKDRLNIPTNKRYNKQEASEKYKANSSGTFKKKNT
jgi:hypothetical protein